MNIKKYIPFLVLFISLSGAAICARLLYLDIYVNRTSIDGLVEAGFIKEKSESVKRKYSESMLWDLVDKNEKLYWNDSIQTADRSQATITLKDGSEIKLGSASLVVLEKENDQLSLNLKSGQLVVDVHNGDTNKIKVNGLTLNQNKGETLALNVDEKKGQLTATSTSADGTGKQIVVGKDGTVEEKEIAASLETPLALYRKVIDTNEENIAFSWKSKNPSQTLEIAEDKDFKKIIYQKETSKLSYESDFKPGQYYWRVRALGKEGPLLSEVRSFEIIKMVVPELLAPTKNKISYRTDLPIIEFTWKTSPLSNGYSIEASTDKNFKNILLKEETLNTTFKTSKIGEGHVYWRVSAIYGTDRKPSSLSEFEVSRLKDTPPPQLVNPAPQFDVNYDFFEENKGIPFKWKFDGKETYKFVFSKDDKLKKELVSFETSQNETLIKEKLEPGTYYWSVGYKNEDGEWAFKEIRKVLIGSLEPTLEAPAFEMQEVQ